MGGSLWDAGSPRRLREFESMAMIHGNAIGERFVAGEGQKQVPSLCCGMTTKKGAAG
jgi:hypothetical protein